MLVYVVDKKDLNIVKQRRSDAEAILHTQSHTGTIGLKEMTER
jgi:hypothetical protein